MINNSLVIVPSRQQTYEICDYVEQTVSILSQKNLVCVILFSQALSIKDVLKNRFFLKKKKNKIWDKKNNHLIYLRPFFLLPFRRHYKIEQLNIKIYLLVLRLFLKIRFKRYQSKLIWLFYPELFPEALLLGAKSQIILDVVDLIQPDEFWQKKRKEFQKRIRLALKESAIVTTIADSQKMYYHKWRKGIITVPQGFRPCSQKNFSDKNHIKIKSQGRFIVGFIGHINERLDISLLEPLLRRNPRWLFVFVGPFHHESKVGITHRNSLIKLKKVFSKYENALHIEQQSKEELQGIIQQFDVCMIPYNISDPFNLYCYPMKLFEYFYVGKPVVSTPILELKKFSSIIKIGKNAKEWEREIQELVKKPLTKKDQIKLKKIACSNSWANKIEKISELIYPKLNTG